MLKNIIPLYHDMKEWIRYKRILDYRAMPIEKRATIMMEKYEKSLGYKMSINNPATFTEKIQWYKVFYKGSGHLDEVVDKYLFKKYIKDRLGDGYTIPLIGVWDSINSLEKDWKSLPKEFCLKSTVQSGGKWIEFIHDKSQVDFKQKKKEWSKWFLPKLTLVNGLTQAYRDCTPRIIAEQYVENIKDQLFDYKFFCFNGSPFCIYVAQDHFGKDGSHISFYDLDWNKMDVQYGNHLVGDAPSPKHLKEMIEISKALSKDFPFIRVDFFDTDSKLYVAELTLYPGGGYTPYKPEGFNKRMGELFVLPID